MNYILFPGEVPIQFISAGQFIAKNHSVHPRRKLDSHVLLIGIGGEYPIAQDGREYMLREDTFMLLFAGSEHYGTLPASELQSHFWCHFLQPESSVCEANRIPRESEKITLPEYGSIVHMEKYRILFRQMIDAKYRSYAEPSLCRFICDSYLNIILRELTEDCIEADINKNSPRSDKRQELARRVAEWIRLHATEGIKPRDVAEYFKYSNDYLTQVFKCVHGETIGGFINTVKLNEAKKLLLNTDMHIAEIACRTGFEDEKYFMKRFKENEAVTPSEYRCSCCRIHMNTK